MENSSTIILKLLAVFLFFYFKGISQTSSNCFKTFNISFSDSSKRLEFNDAIPTSDGGYLIGGRDQFTNRGILIKLNGQGNIEWSKVTTYEPSKVLLCKDSNYLVCINQEYDCQILKLKKDGSLIWSKIFTNNGGFPSHKRLYDIKETSYGGFLMVFNGHFGYGYIDNSIVHIDSTGGIIWRKGIMLGNNYPVIKSITLKDNEFYIASDFYGSSGIDIAKLSIQTGNFIWAKRYKINSSYGLFDPHIEIQNDTLCIATIMSSGGAFVVNKLSILLLDKNNGSRFTSYFFEKPQMSYNVTYYVFHGVGPFHFTKTIDNNLFFSQLVYYNNDTALNATKFSLNGNIIWSKSFANYKKRDVWSVHNCGDEMLIAGRQYKGYPNTTNAAFIIRLDKNGLISTNNSNPPDSCNATSIIPQIQNVIIYDTTTNFISTINDTLIKLKDTIPNLKDISISSFEHCSTISQSCDSLTITGVDSICQSNQVTQFTAHKFGLCDNYISWTFDTTKIKLISKTDSSIDVKFQTNGNLTLTAKLTNSCSNQIQAVKTIAVAKSSASLNLGFDTLFCSPFNFLLNAKSGYKNYLWSNGLTDSIINISKFGNYFVKVTDFCNSNSIDSINITVLQPKIIDNTLKGCYSVSLNNKIYTSTQTVADTIKSKNNCDSIYHNYNIIVYNVLTKTIIDSASGCSSVKYNGIIYNTSTTLKDTIKTIWGCDSIYNIHQIIVQQYNSQTVTDTMFGCNSLIYRGKIYYSNTIVIDTSKTVYGCDSLFGTHYIIIQKITATNFNDTITGCGKAIFRNIIYTSNYILNDTTKTKFGCDSIYNKHNIIIYSLPTIQVSKDTNICFGDAATLLAHSNSNVAWINSYKNPLVIYPNYDTSCKAIAINNWGCKDSAETKITVEHFSVEISLTPNPASKGDKIFVTTLSSQNYIVDNWSSNPKYLFFDKTNTTASFIADSNTLVLIRAASNNGCIDTSSAYLIVRPNHNSLFIPNVFSPNADGVNDTWEIKNLSLFTGVDVNVFNRYGKKVFTSIGYKKSWNGTYMNQGNTLPVGVYYYIINIKGILPKTFTGSVTILK